MKKLLLFFAFLPLLALNLSANELNGQIRGEYVVLDPNPKSSEYLGELNDANFSDKISEGYAIVDFHALWCGPCRVFGPKFAKVAEEMQGLLSFYKVNVDQAAQTCSSESVYSIPTIILYKDGVEVKRTVGNMEEQQLRDFIASGI